MRKYNGKILKRMLAMLLVFVLTYSMIPYSVGVRAAEGSSEPTSNEENIVEENVITDVTIEGKSWVYDGNLKELVTVERKPGDIVTYQVNGGEVTTESPKHSEAGDYEIDVTVSRTGYENLTKKVTSTITAADITDIDIIAEEELIYNEEEQPLVEVSGEFQEGDVVTWEVNGTSTNSSDIPKAMAAGNYTVKLTVNRGTNYKVFSKAVEVEIKPNKINLEGLTVKGLEGVYNGEEQDAVQVDIKEGYSYTLKYQLDEGDKEADETAWTDSIPKVTDAGSYIVWVKAVKENYEDGKVNVEPAKSAVSPFNVYVAQIEQKIKFNSDLDKLDTVIEGEMTYDFSASKVEGGKYWADAKWSYAIGADSDDGIATIDEDGQLTVKDAGKIVIIATLSGNKNYKEASISHTLEITESGELIRFEESDLTYVLGENNGEASIQSATKNYQRDTGEVSYKIDKDDIGIVCNSENGKITVDNYEKLSEEILKNDGCVEVTVTATKEKVEGLYTEATASYNLKITFLNATPKLKIEGDKGKIDEVATDWYIEKITVKPEDDSNYRISKICAPDKFGESVEFEDQGAHERYVYMRYQGGGIVRVEFSAKIDSNAVSSEKMDISYSETISMRGDKETGIYFYNPTVEVTFTVKDEIAENASGLHHINWKYEREGELSSILPNSNGTLTTESGAIKLVDDVDGKRYVATITLPAASEEQLYGKVSFEAVDNAGNSSGFKTGANIIVVDTIAPTLEISYERGDVNDVYVAANGKHYYSGDVKATITVKEANFYEDNVKVKVNGIALDKENALGIEIAWTQDELSPEMHYGTFVLSGDGDYSISITYEDQSGNVMKDQNGEEIVEYTSDVIVIDTTAPKVSVDYGEPENVVGNKTYYGDTVTANISIDEQNFFSEDVVVVVTPEDGEPYKVTPTWNGKEGKFYLDKNGHYAIKVEYKDKCGNFDENESVHLSQEIIVDTIKPELKVEYSNQKIINTVDNREYYDNSQTAIITINEHNFYAEDVVITVSKDGAEPTTTTLSWKDESVDVHTGNLKLAEDGDYIITVNYTDKSLNVMNTYTSNLITIDTIIESPTITINGKNESGKAYKDEVVPAISFEDINFDSYEVTLTRTRYGNKDMDVAKTFIGNRVNVNEKGGSGKFDTFEVKAENDGIYTLTVKMTDKAGHSSQNSVVFTVNRYGSVYEYSDYLVSLIKDGGAYVENVDEDLVITEYNADKLVGSSLVIEITRDGKPLEEVKFDTTPQVINNQVVVGDSGWFQYEYRISKENFNDDGVYKVSVSSKDETGNTPENSNYEDMDILFRVDATAPEITNITGLEDSIIDASEVTVNYTVFDVLGLKSIKVIVNGKQVGETITNFGEDMNNYNGSFVLKESSDTQSVQIIVEDLAGNITDTDAKEFDSTYAFNSSVTVSTNFFVRWYANQPLFWGSIIGAITLIGAVVIVIVVKRKKKEEQ